MAAAATEPKSLPQRRVYPRPPIVEAIVQFSFAKPLHAKQEKVLSPALLAEFAGKRNKVERLAFTAHVSADALTTSASRRTHATLFSSEDGLRVVGVGDDLLSAHVLPPYPGWANFRDLVEQVAAGAIEEVRHAQLAEVTIRYLDVIAFPEKVAHLEEYLTCAPAAPRGAGGVITWFDWTTQRHDEHSGDTTVLAVKAQPPENGRPRILIDIASATRLAKDSTLVNSNSWLPVIVRLHELQGTMFEDSIKEKMSGLFE